MPHSEFDDLNQRKQHFSLDRKDTPMNFLDGTPFPENQDKLSDAVGLENALALTPLACIIASASFVVSRNGHQTDKQRIDEPGAIRASQGVFA
jgi:hypothetical protein